MSDLYRRLLSNRGRSSEAIPRRAPGSAIPLSWAQERMWFLEQLSAGSTVWHVPRRLRVRGSLDLDALRTALADVQQRHAALRTVFTHVDGALQQHIEPTAALDIAVDDLRAIAADAQQHEIKKLRAISDAPFDLERGPLWRTRVVRLADDEHLLWFTLHHAITDGWSMRVFFEDLDAAYQARLRGETPALPPLALEYADYAAWQRCRGDDESGVDYWRQQLADLEPLVLRSLPTGSRTGARRGHVVSAQIPKAIIDRMKALCQAHDATLFMGLLAAFYDVLRRCGAGDDLAIGTPVACRLQREVRGLMGLFVNTVVLRTNVSGTRSFADLLARTRATALDGFAHQEVPFDQVVHGLRRAGSSGDHPLFNAMFVLQNTRTQEPRLGTLDVSSGWMPRTTAMFDVTMTIGPRDNGDHYLALEVDADLLSPATAEAIVGRYQALLASVIESPDRPLAELAGGAASMQPAVRARAPEVLLELDRWARETPHAPAVITDTTSISHGELDQRVRRVASALRAHGVGPECRVGIVAYRGRAQITALLATLRAGGVYIPMRPDLPADRLQWMIDDAQPSILLVDGALPAGVEARGATVVTIADALEARVDHPTTWTDAPPDSLAYVIYTSGSTGRPKGVMISRTSMEAQLGWMQREFAFTPADRMLQLSSVMFDFSIVELLWPLIAGGAVVIPPPDSEYAPDYLAQLTRDLAVTVINFAPALLGAIVDSHASQPWSTIRLLFVGGEALPLELARRTPSVFPAAELHNQYGPTETTINTTSWRCTAADETMPIGRAVDDTPLHVLDAGLQPVAPGVLGELWVGGLQVARGYLGRPDLTSERFVPDPFSARAGARMYRSGDVVWRRSDGVLEYIGRVDFQVKIRGYRIELGEIEHVLSQLPTVRENVVIVREDTPGDRRLVAYVVARRDMTIVVDTLRTELAARLPGYMVPAAFVILDELPVTTNGKVDRRALPVPAAGTTTEYVPPRTPDEAGVAAAFEAVLKIERVGAHDSFFARGGNSLLAVRLLAQLRRALDVEIPLRLIFERDSVEELARALDSYRASSQDIASRPQLFASGAIRAPVTPPQRGTFLVDRDNPRNRMTRTYWSARIEGEIDTAALERALRALRERHRSLRTRIVEDGDELWQQVVPAAELSPALLQVSDVSGAAEHERERRAFALIEEHVDRPFDLAAGDLLRAIVVRLSTGVWHLVVSIHRIVADDVALDVFVDELGKLWSLFTTAPGADPAPLLPHPGLQYVELADYLARRRASPSGAADRAFWTERLDGIELLALPTDRPRDAVEARREAARGFVALPCGTVHGELEPDAVRQAERVAQEQHASLMATLLAAQAAYLHSRSGQDDLSLVTFLSYRHLAGLERCVGQLANPLGVRIRANGSPTFRELVDRTRAAVADAYEHAECDVIRLAPHRLFRLCFNYLQPTAGASSTVSRTFPPGLSLTPSSLESETDSIAYDLMVFVRKVGDRGKLRMAYNLELFDESTAQGMLAGFAEAVGRLARAPDRPVASVLVPR